MFSRQKWIEINHNLVIQKKSNFLYYILPNDDSILELPLFWEWLGMLPYIDFDRDGTLRNLEVIQNLLAKFFLKLTLSLFDPTNAPFYIWFDYMGFSDLFNLFKCHPLAIKFISSISWINLQQWRPVLRSYRWVLSF